MATHLQLQEEVETQYQLFRNEADARKMLVSDIIELKYRVDAPAMKSDSSSEKDDTTLIKFKLKLVHCGGFDRTLEDCY